MRDPTMDGIRDISWHLKLEASKNCGGLERERLKSNASGEGSFPHFSINILCMSADFGLPGAYWNIPLFVEWCHFDWSNQGVPIPHPRNRENPANESISFESPWVFLKVKSGGAI